MRLPHPSRFSKSGQSMVTDRKNYRRKSPERQGRGIPPLRNERARMWQPQSVDADEDHKLAKGGPAAPLQSAATRSRSVLTCTARSTCPAFPPSGFSLIPPSTNFPGQVIHHPRRLRTNADIGVTLTFHMAQKIGHLMRIVFSPLADGSPIQLDEVEVLGKPLQ